MNRRLAISFASVVLLLSPAALAEPPDAGATPDQSFSPGPGGGEQDAGTGRPPLESTGLEDTDFGCGCRTAGRPAPGAHALLAAALAGGAAWRRRRSRGKR